MIRAHALFFVVLGLVMALAGVVHADDADSLPALGSPTTLTVIDGRDADQRGDESLGWYETSSGELSATGPEGFSMRSEVTSAFYRAGDELGAVLYEGAKGTERHHIEVIVREFWCRNSIVWTQCRTSVTGSLSGPNGTTELIAFDGEVEGNTDDLRDVLYEALLLDLARAQSEGLGAPVKNDGAEHPSMRFGWVERADGSRFVGAVRDVPQGICVEGRGARQTTVPIDEIVDVRIVDVSIPGGVQSTRWAVLPFADGSWLGGRILRNSRESTAFLTPDGARITGPERNLQIVSGSWNVEGPQCQVARGTGVVGGGVGSYGVSLKSDTRVNQPKLPEDTPVVYVDGRGEPIDELDITHKHVFGLRAFHLGDRRWKRHRLNWVSYASEMDSRQVDQSLDEWIALNRRRKANWTGALAGGIGMAVASGVTSGLLTLAWADTGDNGISITIPFVAVGIGIGSAIAGVSAYQRLRWGKRADRPERYHNLIDYLTLDELDALRDEQESQAEEL